MAVTRQVARAGRCLEKGQAGYPAELRDAVPVPERIYLCGSIAPRPRVALVGARRCDDYGLRMARQLGEQLARAGVCVVSGGAGGVDTAALEGALAGGGRPVAVLGTGCDVSYPAGNRGLFDRLAEHGALLSEYEPGTPGQPFQFARRNRLISALAEAVVVVRAAERSGSLLTAACARRQGRLLMAVPGPAGHPLSAGCHRLIRQGASLVEGPQDVLDLLKPVPAGKQPSLPLESPRAPEPRLSPEEQHLYQLLQQGRASVDELARRCGWGTPQVAATLLQMELKGCVQQRPGMVYELARAG